MNRLIKALEEIIESEETCGVTGHQWQVVSLERIPPFKDRFLETSKCTKCAMFNTKEVDG